MQIKEKVHVNVHFSSSSLLMLPFTNNMNLRLNFIHPGHYKLSQEFRSWCDGNNCLSVSLNYTSLSQNGQKVHIESMKEHSSSFKSATKDPKGW